VRRRVARRAAPVYERDVACSETGTVFEVDSGIYRTGATELCAWVYLNAPYFFGPADQHPLWAALSTVVHSYKLSPGRFGIMHNKKRWNSVRRFILQVPNGGQARRLWYVTFIDFNIHDGDWFGWFWNWDYFPGSAVWVQLPALGPMYSWPALLRRGDWPELPPAWP
jgi:hypothetical protein